jgi:pimeloyl-ACP methyl ester carboxylesterase
MTKIYYREAGRVDAPTLLLLHGFPSAGELIPAFGWLSQRGAIGRSDRALRPQHGQH